MTPLSAARRKLLLSAMPPPETRSESKVTSMIRNSIIDESRLGDDDKQVLSGYLDRLIRRRGRPSSGLLSKENVASLCDYIKERTGVRPSVPVPRFLFVVADNSYVCVTKAAGEPAREVRGYKDMSIAEYCKLRGVSLNDMAGVTGESLNTLRNWFVTRRAAFEFMLTGYVQAVKDQPPK